MVNSSANFLMEQNNAAQNDTERGKSKSFKLIPQTTKVEAPEIIEKKDDLKVQIKDLK